jgi:hypothetical protein
MAQAEAQVRTKAETCDMISKALFEIGNMTSLLAKNQLTQAQKAEMQASLSNLA